MNLQLNLFSKFNLIVDLVNAKLKIKKKLNKLDSKLNDLTMIRLKIARRLLLKDRTDICYIRCGRIVVRGERLFKFRFI